MAGMTVVGQCEMDPFCQSVLDKHWPGVPRWADVRSVTGESVRERCGDVDLVCGGFPCQPVSSAGKRQGEADERWLWPEMLRIIREVAPRWIVAENVPGLRSLGADGVLMDLEAAGYAAWPLVVGADDVGASHRRKRVFIVARLMADDLSDRGREATARETAGRPNDDERSRAMADAGQRRRRTQASADEHGQGADRTRESGDDVAEPDIAGRERERSGGLLDGERPALRDDAHGCGGEAMADSIGARLEGWSSLAGDDGQERATTERDRDGLADATHGRREARTELDSEASDLGRLDADGRGGDGAVADAERDESERRGGSRGVASSPGSGGADGAERQRVRDAADDRGAIVADARRQRGERRTPSAQGMLDHGADAGRLQSEREPPGGGGPALPLWPPGPSDLDAWARVLELEPGLAPAHEEAQPQVRGVAHGLPPRLARRWRRLALKALGNAVVPACAYVIGRAVMEVDASGAASAASGLSHQEEKGAR